MTVKIAYLYNSLNNSVGRLPILMFHSVNITKEGLDPMSPRHFESYAKILKHKGYKTITAKQAYEYNVNKIPLPNNVVWLTFDDGWLDNLTYAAPILAKYGHKATMFVETSKIGGTYRATLAQLKTLHDIYGWDIQSHGHVGHDTVPIDDHGGTGGWYESQEWLTSEGRLETKAEHIVRVLADFESSKTALASINDVCAFAYPGGSRGLTADMIVANDEALNAASFVGVLVSSITGQPITNTINTPKHCMGRIGIAPEVRVGSGTPATGSDFSVALGKINCGALTKDEDGNNLYARFLYHDTINNRLICGSIDGKIFTIGEDFVSTSEPVSVLPPEDSVHTPPASYIAPTVMPNGDVWVCSITDQMVYKLDKDDLGAPALEEVTVGLWPYGIANDGEYLYVLTDSGQINRIDPETLEVTSPYMTLSDDGAYEQIVICDGKAYIGDYKYRRILVYDITSKAFVEYWTYPKPGEYRFFPWNVTSSNTVACFDTVTWQNFVLKKF